MQFHCPHCTQELEMPDSHQGKQVVCSTCANLMTCPVLVPVIEKELFDFAQAEAIEQSRPPPHRRHSMPPPPQQQQQQQTIITTRRIVIAALVAATVIGYFVISWRFLPIDRIETSMGHRNYNKAIRLTGEVINDEFLFDLMTNRERGLVWYYRGQAMFILDDANACYCLDEATMYLKRAGETGLAKKAQEIRTMAARREAQKIGLFLE